MKHYSKDDILSEIERLGLDLSALNERQHKQLVASALMKSIYEPLTEAVIKCYEEQLRLTTPITISD